MNNDEIIKNSHYPAYVVASAGTGKTELIARKVEHLLIEENVDIDKIALITFTNKATAETIERIKGKLYQAWLNGNKSLRLQSMYFATTLFESLLWKLDFAQTMQYPILLWKKKRLQMTSSKTTMLRRSLKLSLCIKPQKCL